MGQVCPVRGGNVDTKLGETFGHCPYRHAAVVVQDSTIVQRYVVEGRLTPDTAQYALPRSMHPDSVAGLAAKCKLPTLPALLLWLPVCYLRSAKSKAAAAAEYLADEHAAPETVARLVPPGAMERVREYDTLRIAPAYALAQSRAHYGAKQPNGAHHLDFERQVSATSVAAH